MPKSPLDLLIAVGKSGKSKAPPTEEAPEMLEEESVEESVDMPLPEMHAEPDGDENSITLPPGFKPPDGSEDGKPFTTTVRGLIRDGRFYPESIGDMPLDAKEAPIMEGEAEAVEEATGDYAAKKAEADAARNAFQS